MLTERVSTPPRLIPSTRFTLALLVSYALFIQYAQRLSLSMAIVCMVNRTNIDIVSKTNSYHSQVQNVTTPTPIIKYGSQLLKEKQLFLNEFQQQILLGAYWLGGTLGLIPGIQTKRDLILKYFIVSSSLIQVVGYQSRLVLNKRFFLVFS